RACCESKCLTYHRASYGWPIAQVQVLRRLHSERHASALPLRWHRRARRNLKLAQKDDAAVETVATPAVLRLSRHEHVVEHHDVAHGRAWSVAVGVRHDGLRPALTRAQCRATRARRKRMESTPHANCGGRCRLRKQTEAA